MQSYCFSGRFFRKGAEQAAGRRRRSVWQKAAVVLEEKAYARGVAGIDEVCSLFRRLHRTNPVLPRPQSAQNVRATAKERVVKGTSARAGQANPGQSS